MSDFSHLRSHLPEIQAALRDAGLGGWLLFDLHARNSAAMGVLGLGDLTRRYFVLIPPEGAPRALTHRIEQHPFAHWAWEKQQYSSWRELHAALPWLIGDAKRVGMEISANGAVPAMDLVPAGIVELIRGTGVEVVTSGDLVSQFASSWTDAQLASHKRASAVLAQVAHSNFERLARTLREGLRPTERDLREWVLADLAERGAGVGADTITANGVNAANPHYELEGRGAEFKEGDVVLLDLWSKESDDMVYADQTWMACLGRSVPARAREVFEAVRDAREAAVKYVQDAFEAGRDVQGYELDDAARSVIRERGFGDYFIHRTGHSIDRSTHGMGPNIDNFETHETRRLVRGVGFSIEPGIYIPGEIGVRSEINMYIDESGPIVTTPGPQSEMLALL
ncbi:MAG TPA: M24 family metallopeptidase [Longimicrobiales bacterium]|nr:M24 family metallopeptidase [Longimicrobiales bacterium]